jgi:hypothetical protein
MERVSPRRIRVRMVKDKMDVRNPSVTEKERNRMIDDAIGMSWQ